MPVALKKPTIDELYRQLRNLDYSQVDELMAVMLNAVFQIESQGVRRASAMEMVLMAGDTSYGISNQEQTRRLSWSTDGGLRGLGLAEATRGSHDQRPTDVRTGASPQTAVVDAKSRDRKVKMLNEHLVIRSRPESNMEVEEAPRATGRFNLKRISQDQMSPFLRDLDTMQTKLLSVDVVLPGLATTSTPRQKRHQLPGGYTR